MDKIDKYDVQRWSFGRVLNEIEDGKIAIPEIQRPFVWKNTQVRDLIDSLFLGYPAGYLITWASPDVKLKNGDSASGKTVLIDGQQRVTALMAALSGKEVFDSNYKSKRINIAFNPFPEDNETYFAVTNSVHKKSPKWIDDISIFFNDFDSFEFVNEYVEANPEVRPKELNKIVGRITNINNSAIGVIELDKDLDIEEVTEIFERINSKGTKLNRSDLAMSKLASNTEYQGDILRKVIDYFCYVLRDPSKYSDLIERDNDIKKSEFYSSLKWLKNFRETIFLPEYKDMIRVAFMSEFPRAKISDLVSLLSGRNFKERTFEDLIIEETYKKLNHGILSYINEHNFKEFILLLKELGFKTSKQFNSSSILSMAYTLFLRLRASKQYTTSKIKHFVKRWLILSILTQRYSGASESTMELDLKEIESRGIEKTLEVIEKAELSNDFWEVTLPQKLDTTSKSPLYNLYLAAQIKNKENALISDTPVEDIVVNYGDQHHIFPKEYLKKNGYDKNAYNQIANLTPIGADLNREIGSEPPSSYFAKLFKQCETKKPELGLIVNRRDLENSLIENSIPLEIRDYDHKSYWDFINKRRELMAKKMKNYYYSL